MGFNTSGEPTARIPNLNRSNRYGDGIYNGSRESGNGLKDEITIKLKNPIMANIVGSLDRLTLVSRVKVLKEKIGETRDGHDIVRGISDGYPKAVVLLVITEVDGKKIYIPIKRYIPNI